MQTRFLTQRRSSLVAVACLVLLVCTACGDPGSDSVVLTADLSLHLEDHLNAATIEGSEVPADLPEPVEWRFDEPQPGWKLAYGYEFSQKHCFAWSTWRVTDFSWSPTSVWSVLLRA